MTAKKQASTFKKGQKVIRILSCAGVETGTIATVESVKNGVVTLEGWGLKHDAATGAEIDGLSMGSVRIICFDGE
jgi:hypothetical protein